MTPYSVRAGVRSSIVRVYFLSYIEGGEKNWKSYIIRDKMIKALTDSWQLSVTNSHLFSHTATSKYSILLLHLKQMLKFCKTLTFVLLLELPEAVPFILQYCSASLAMSEINFWEAREIRRILKKQKRKIIIVVFTVCSKSPSDLISSSKKSIQQPSQRWQWSPRHNGLYLHTYLHTYTVYITVVGCL